jgi:hypothetical protein
MSNIGQFLIHRCANSHHFVAGACPFCGGLPVQSYPYREGDCVACGVFCPDYGYGCNSPEPLSIKDFHSLTNEQELQLGSKHHLITEAQEIPLAVLLTGANIHDVTQLLPLVEAIPPIRGKRGRPRSKPVRH